MEVVPSNPTLLVVGSSPTSYPRVAVAQSVERKSTNTVSDLPSPDTQRIDFFIREEIEMSAGRCTKGVHQPSKLTRKTGVRFSRPAHFPTNLLSPVDQGSRLRLGMIGFESLRERQQLVSLELSPLGP